MFAFAKAKFMFDKINFNRFNCFVKNTTNYKTEKKPLF
ncbi:hypothetical protein NMS_1408 [Nonlabens marinus S1-08]|uniref:Uncharacterized protein n=1 Tax=Nonlabens marinus S1-08 TaxID=1454201 RepID=W8VX71_9FLAO|nr:hypothetical protein NMS_1408 [Nonlabens marinus S1-08]